MLNILSPLMEEITICQFIFRIETRFIPSHVALQTYYFTYLMDDLDYTWEKKTLDNLLSGRILTSLLPGIGIATLDYRQFNCAILVRDIIKNSTILRVSTLHIRYNRVYQRDYKATGIVLEFFFFFFWDIMITW